MLGDEHDLPDESATNDLGLKRCWGWPREERRAERPKAVAISLAPEDGYIAVVDSTDLMNGITAANQDEPIELYRPGADRAVVLPIMKKEIGGLAPLRFSEFADRYILVPRFWRGHPNVGLVTSWPHDQPIPIYLISHAGQVDVVQLPAGAATPYGAFPTRAGLLWVSNNAPSGNTRDAGGWLISASRVRKLFEHFVTGIGVSPDGCKVSYATKGNDARTVDIVHIIDLCPVEVGGRK